MIRNYPSLILGLLLIGLGCGQNNKKAADSPEESQNGGHKQTLSTNIYDYSFTTLEGKTVKLSQFKGKKMLIVNTASECGYTPQYEQLEKVSKQFEGKLVVIGFPTNDFGKQEPGSNADIKSFCTKNYGVTFPMSEKITVKGDSMHPIYKWLTQKSLNGKLDSEIKWNFQKYLISEDGKLVQMFISKVKPDDQEVTNEIDKK